MPEDKIVRIRKSKKVSMKNYITVNRRGQRKGINQGSDLLSNITIEDVKRILKEIKNN